MQSQSETNKDIEQLRQWMKDSGCLIHPAVQIPAFFDGIQGIGVRQHIPHKTVIIAIPSKLVITVPRCYSDPQLKSLFKSCDDLFDYESDEDAQFNILCVFLMFQKMNIEKSPWKVYLKTIAKPETAVSWPDVDLAGLNKSVIQQILHVRQQCKKVEQKLCQFLKKSKQFKHLSYQQILELFRTCYPTVLTRCFGYYFSTACMIPIADLMNHGCETIDHQLIHLNFENDKEFDETYNKKKHKLNIELMGLEKPQKQTMPFRLDFLLKNKLIQNDLQSLAQIRRKGIDEKIYAFLSERLKNDDSHQIEKVDFCEEDDQQDNDTDEDEQYGQTKSLEYIKVAQKQQMVQFQQYYLQVQKLGDVQRKIKEKYGAEQLDDSQTKDQSKKTKTEVEKPAEQAKVEANSQEKQANQEKNEDQSDSKTKAQSSENQSPSKDQKQKSSFLVNENMCPIEYAEKSSEESSCSEEEEWCLDETCYFTMSTHAPVNAGSQLFNSYGSRTNKFLLVWYGFAYRDNLYDSVTFRLQANFPQIRPKAKDIILDTYVGGQGLCFKKNEEEYVQPEQVSRQFRLKRTRLPLEFLMFLRLFLTNYYQGKDNYKILCTVPSSLEFELELLSYFKDIVQNLYQRYPLQIIQKFKEMLETESDQSRKNRINFKVIYLEEQRKILDANMDAVQAAIQIIRRLQKTKKMSSELYSDLKISTIRKIRQYLVELKTNFNYILYSQTQRPSTEETA